MPSQYHFSRNDVSPIRGLQKGNSGSEPGITSMTNVYENEGFDASQHGVTATDDSSAYIAMAELRLPKYGHLSLNLHCYEQVLLFRIYNNYSIYIEFIMSQMWYVIRFRERNARKILCCTSLGQSHWPHTISVIIFLATLNSLAPGGFDYNLKLVNFKLISMTNIFSIFCEIAIRWIPQHLTDH